MVADQYDATQMLKNQSTMMKGNADGPCITTYFKIHLFSFNFAPAEGPFVTTASIAKQGASKAISV